MNNSTLPVAIKEDFFEILYSIHCLQTHHSGQIKTFSAISKRYHNLPKRIVVTFIHVCPPCNLKKIQLSQPRLHPIRFENRLYRFQIDLIDMPHNKQELDSRRYVEKNVSKKAKEDRRLEDEINGRLRYWEWIAHVMDHLSKFHIIWAQETKTME